MGEKGEPVTFAVFAKSNEYPTPIRISGYSGTMDEIRQQVLGRARREGFRGDFVERMADLGWWLEPLMTVAQHERIVAGLEADARRYRGLRDGCLWTLTSGTDGTRLSAYMAGVSLSQIGPDDDEFDAAIDAFLAQTAEG